MKHSTTRLLIALALTSLTPLAFAVDSNAAALSAPAAAATPAAPAGQPSGAGGHRKGDVTPFVRIEPLADAVEVELTPPLDQEQGNFKQRPRTTWEEVKGIEVKAGTPRGKVIAFSAPPTLEAAAAPDAVAVETAPAAAPNAALAGAHSGPRACWVYIPAGYKEGDVLPFMVDHDGRADAVVQVQLIAALDTLMAEKKIPMMAAVFIAPVRRSIEYDTVSGVYADYIEKVVLPLAEKTGGLKLSRGPDARGVIGQSSGSAAAFGMAWFGTPAYHRVISYSGSWTQLQKSATARKGAQEYQETLIPNTPKKPIRIWMQVGSNDLNNRFGDWRVQNNAFANALKAKGYAYQYLWSEDAGHVEAGVEKQTMLEAVEWVWKTYKGPASHRD